MIINNLINKMQQITFPPFIDKNQLNQVSKYYKSILKIRLSGQTVFFIHLATARCWSRVLARSFGNRKTCKLFSGCWMNTNRI